MALTKEAIENLTEAVKHVQQASEEGILYAMMSVPGMGSPGYGVTVMKKGRVAEGEGMEGAGQPCDREWLLNKDVLKACGQYMDVYSLARARGVCREFYHDFQPQAGHKPFYVATVDACLRDVYGLGAPSLSVMALAGRTASSRRYIITTYSSPTHNPLQKMYFVSSAPGVVRELRAAIASCDPTAPICTIAIDNLPIDTARGKLARAAYDNHALDRFWDWCHPDLHDQYKPTLSIC
eukprot:TRINITY_DN30742_c0_g1_i1.p1 TRINITY_DN30742_c0_g1~~TRINITY_DN30742_c0_g1_i1.p1  ORF type:complete len:237 (+),score=49.44 TRINITY_DN30742_c0_g1_i1:48-758(+)